MVFFRPGPNYRGGVRQPVRKPEPARNRAAPSRAGPGDRRGPSQPSGRGARAGGPGQKDNKKKVCIRINIWSQTDSKCDTILVHLNEVF